MRDRHDEVALRSKFNPPVRISSHRLHCVLFTYLGTRLHNSNHGVHDDKLEVTKTI